MKPKRHTSVGKQILAAGIALAAWGMVSGGAEPAPQPIDQAIVHLGDSDPAVRDQAAQELRQAGAAARAALEAASAGDDPEVAARARDILRSVAAEPAPVSIKPQEPDPEMQRYQIMPPAEKLEKINELAVAPGGIHTLTRLWLIETDQQRRDTIFEHLVADSSTAAAALLGDGNAASAELLLDAAVDKQSPGSPRAYAAYWLSRGKLEQVIRRWAARGGQDAWAEEVLSALYRAKGDGTAAVSHAQATHDRDILQEALLWAGQWQSLADKIRGDNIDPREPRDISLRVGADALSGNANAVNADVVQLQALVHNEAEAQTAASILLVINRPDDAQKVLLDSRLYYFAYEILLDRGQFEQAAALLAAHDTDLSQDALRLRAAAAMGYARLGLAQKFKEMTARLARENEGNRFPRVYLALAEAERVGGMIDESWEHFSVAVTTVEENSIPWYVGRAFPMQGKSIDWSELWTASMVLRPDRTAKDLFGRFRHAYDQSIALDDLVKAVASVDLSDESNRPYGELLWEAARRLRTAGREPEARQLLDTAAAKAGNGDLYVRLGDLAAENNDWTKAAAQYELGWNKDRTQALPLYLQGWAMSKAGHVAEGRERMELAHVLPTSDELRRSALMRGLDMRGLDEAAAREADVLIRLGDPASMSMQDALRIAATYADERGDHALAAALWERAIADYLAAGYTFVNDVEYLHLPNTVRQSRARALIAAGDMAGARREIQSCLEMLPVDSSIVIEVVPDLDKFGHKEEADALFAKMFAIQQGLVDRCPDSPYQLNEYAWLAARCHRELDKALDAARRSVAADKDPYPVDVVDTLAEVHFERGDAKSALAEEKKCIALAPDNPFHRKQLKRFQADVERIPK